MIVAMPTRGSNDNIISLLLFIALYLLLSRRFILAGFFYGLSVHFKIYPIIYSFVLFFWIDMDMIPFGQLQMMTKKPDGIEGHESKNELLNKWKKERKKERK